MFFPQRRAGAQTANVAVMSPGRATVRTQRFAVTDVRRLTRIGILGLGLLVLLAALRPWLPADAQGPAITVQSASLRLWPEYDDPGLLVIYAGALADTVALPTQVAFPLPDGARGIQATVQDSSGSLLNQPWEIVDGTLTYTLTQASFHIEYYLDRPPSGDQRELSYTFQTNYAVAGVEISIQQPARATGFSVTPQPEGSSVGGDGLTYFRISRANLTPGDSIPLTIRYTKTDQGFSIAPVSTESSQPAAQPGAAASAQSAAPNRWLPWLLIGFGLVTLAGLGTYWYLSQRRSVEPVRDAKSGRVRPAGPVARAMQGANPAFCTQCGRQFRPDDRFCAHCGAPRRS